MPEDANFGEEKPGEPAALWTTAIVYTLKRHAGSSISVAPESTSESSEPLIPMHIERKSTSESGFTLIELLIVMSLILILMTLAIPGYESVHKSADEKSAMASLRALNAAENEYYSTYPTHGYACTTAALGGKQGSGTPSPESAQLVADDLAAGVKSGYVFAVTCGSKNTTNNTEQFNSYTITAVPQTVNVTGNRGFCTDTSGQIRIDYKGGTNCTDLLQ